MAPKCCLNKWVSIRRAPMDPGLGEPDAITIVGSVFFICL